ncbi:DUF805 domain-containing protein [Deinococcus ruber]|uniref:DUF805 domain-containing protein n=1 Tax=Deinococcus ruber TaxID=1848197 RepID=UPI001664CFF7
MFLAINNTLFLAFLFLGGNLGLSSKDFTTGYLSGIYTLATTIPLSALSVRRRHDIGQSAGRFCCCFLS